MSRSARLYAHEVKAGDRVQLLDGESGAKSWRLVKHVDTPETGPLVWILEEDDTLVAMPRDAELWVMPAPAS